MKAVPRLSITVGIICHEQADTIGAVIQSAQTQTRPADEILLVDDGSRDESITRVRSFPNVRLIVHERNKGRAAARTTVLREASGDVVVYLDGDTTADAGLVAAVESEITLPSVGAVGALVSESCVETVYDRWRAKHGTVRHVDIRDDDAKVLYGWGLTVRRRLALDLGGFRPGSEDIDLSIRLREAGYRLVLTSHARVQHLRKDDRRSLTAMMHRWSLGAYIAFARNGDYRVLPHAQRMIRQWRGRVRRDLLEDVDLAMVGVDCLVLLEQVRGLWQARRFRKDSAGVIRSLPGL